jgi:hypothetical protein
MAVYRGEAQYVADYHGQRRQDSVVDHLSGLAGGVYVLDGKHEPGLHVFRVVRFEERETSLVHVE